MEWKLRYAYQKIQYRNSYMLFVKIIKMIPNNDQIVFIQIVPDGKDVL